jgi:hypothetical protein
MANTRHRSARLRRWAHAVTLVAFIVSSIYAPLPGHAQGAAAPQIVVTSTNNDGPGSLRQALRDAANAAGAAIAFNIPRTDPQFHDGVFTIPVEAAMPAIAANNTIVDGSTEAAFLKETERTSPIIVLKGRAGTKDDGLKITASNCVVKSLVLNGFGGAGILLSGQDAHTNRITACFIGTDATGNTAAPNQIGISIVLGAHDNIIGDTIAAGRNVIAGNTQYEVQMTGAGTAGNIVQGSSLGLSADGTTALPNAGAVLIGNGAATNTIGGRATGARNVIVGQGNEGFGVCLQGAATNGNLVQGNYIGTNNDGTQLLATCPYGVLISDRAQDNVIGGTEEGARNIIAAHHDGSINISFCRSNRVQGNYLGSAPNGTATVGNGTFGIYLYAASGNIVGGVEPGAGNLVGGNHSIGIGIFAESASGVADNNVIEGNVIGLDITHKAILGEDASGIVIAGPAHNNVVGLDLDGNGLGNIIVCLSKQAGGASRDGVRLDSGEKASPTGNTIRGNAIFSNTGLAINLRAPAEKESQVTPNDDGDTDQGANGLQNFPIISSAMTEGGHMTIKGTLESLPNTKFLIDLYSNSNPGPSGYGPSEIYLGRALLTTDENGHGRFSFYPKDKITGRFITATATNTDTGDTSELSQAVELKG